MKREWERRFLLALPAAMAVGVMGLSIVWVGVGWGCTLSCLGAGIGVAVVANARLWRRTEDAETLLNGKREFVWLLDGLGRLVRANETALKSVGVSEDEILGKAFAETPWCVRGWLGDGEGHDQLKNALTQAREGKFSRFMATQPEGLNAPEFEVSLTPRLDTQGRVEFIVVEGRDISEQSCIQRKLQESEEWHRALFNASSIPTILSDSEDCIIVINDAMVTCSGFSREDMIGKKNDHYTNHTHVPDWVWEKLYTAGQVDNYELEMVRKDGATTHISMNFKMKKIGGKDYIIRFIKLIDERKAPEARLIESERKLSMSVSAGGAAIWEWELSTGKIDCSDWWYEMLGYELGAFPPNIESIRELIHPEDQEYVSTAMRACWSRAFHERSEGFSVEGRLRHRSGRWIWVQSRGNVVSWDSNGNAKLLAGINVDITARREAEAAKRDSDQRLREFFDLSLVGMSVSTGEGGLLEVNGEFCRMLGYTREELKGLGWAKVTHPDDLNLNMQTFNRMLAGESDTFAIEKRYIRKDGEIVYASIASRAIRRADRTIDHLLTVIQDITEKTLTERAAKESRALVDAIFTSAPAALSLVKDRKIVAVSDYALHLFGYDRSEMVGSSTRIIYYNDEDFLRAATAITPTGDTATTAADFTLRRKDGSPLHVLMFGAPLEPGNLAAGIVVSAVDVSTLMKAEEKLKTALAQAESANRAKDMFLAAASHELRTPLTPVLLIASTLEMDTTISPEVREDIRTLRENVLIQKRLIDDLLDFTAIHAGRLRVKMVETKLSSVLDAAIRTCQPEATRRGVIIQRSFASDAGVVVGDPERLRQLFWNLVQNSVKFTPVGGRVTVKMAVMADMVVTEVVDTGIGIHPEEIPRLFDPFMQGRQTEVLHHGGLGLGLAIAQAVAHAHGGVIKASSPGAGLGTTMRVELPVSASLSMASADSGDSRLEMQPAEAEVGPVVVLIVEDDEEAADVLRRTVSSLGHRVLSAATREGAADLIRQAPVDVLIYDADLARGLVKELADLTTQGTRVVAIADGQEVSVAADISLARPVTPETMREAMVRILAERRKMPGAVVSR